MKIDLFKRVALKKDISDQGLRNGDVATIVEHLPGKNTEDGYVLDVFNAVGESIAVVTVPESAVESLTADEIPFVRPLVTTGVSKRQSCGASQHLGRSSKSPAATASATSIRTKRLSAARSAAG